MIICSCGGLQHGLLETDPAFALEELDPEKKAKDSPCGRTCMAFIFISDLDLVKECQPTLQAT